MNEEEYACKEHGWAKLPDGYDHCPQCRMEQQREELMKEKAIKNRRREPY